MNKRLLIAATFFTIFHLVFLILYPFKVLDLEIIQLGEFASSYLLGFSSLTDLNNFYLYQGPGSFLIVPTLALFTFGLWGHSALALHLVGVFLGPLFVIIWAKVFIKAYPKINPWFILALIALPFPLIQAAIVNQLIYTHLGAIVWYGALILLSLNQSSDSNLLNILKLFFLGLLSSIGVVYHLTLLPILLGVFYIVIKRAKYLSGLYFFGLLTSLAFFKDKLYDVSTRGELYSLSLTKLFEKLLYLPGHAAPFLSDSGESFSIPTLPVYLAIILFPIFVSKGRSFKLKSRHLNTDILKCILLSSLSMLIVLVTTESLEEVSTHRVDGLRYLVPLIPLLYIAIFYSLSHTPKRRQTHYVLILLVGNLIGTMTYLYPYKISYMMKEARGYIGSFVSFLPEVKPHSIFNSQRSEILIPWYGLRAFNLERSLDLEHHFPSNTNSHQKQLFWIGAGMAQNFQKQKELYLGLTHATGVKRAKNEQFRTTSIRDNCFTLGCTLPFDNDSQVNDAIKIGWLLSSPCHLIDKSVEIWPEIAPFIESIYLSKPEAYECQKNSPKLLAKISRSYLPLNKGLRAMVEELLPLKATFFYNISFKSIADEKRSQYINIYIGNSWYEFLDLHPGDKAFIDK